MAKQTYDGAYNRLLTHEGGYTNDPRDPGGPTNWGITIYDARMYAAEYGWISGRTVTAEDVRAMPKWFAGKVYKSKYWDRMRLDEFPAGFDDSSFDYEVNSGYGRAGKVVRRLVGLPDNTWTVTDEVLNAIHKRNATDLVRAMHDERLNFLHHLSTWDHFGGGWGRRVNEVENYDLLLAKGAPTLLPTANDNVQKAGKGHVPAGTIQKSLPAGGAVATAGGAGFTHWIGQHPLEVVLIGGAIIGTAGIIYLELEKARRTKQEAPTPNTPIVPVTQAA